ncbi:Tpr repeat-containing thioredoxin ttl1 [Thalictrum thalictroides]|uniref:Tpr repeat-containing thioredoxin ttl1 n=1 Tax=Thalictrum thalictroides TaxID=46969 RepID=A0A7J6XC90_THATH|nr:Tpr repeat-containing thioredoxin ttl1 [Thalictrum thalictroides]
MSNSRKPNSEIGFDSLNDRFRTSLSCENKYKNPDFKELDLGSPVSPLRTRTSRGGPIPTPTSSSSSSSGSVSGRTGNNPSFKRSDRGGNNHSGELSGSSDNSPTAADSARSAPLTLNCQLVHRRSTSTSSPLIHSGGSASSSSSGCGGGGLVNPPVVNALPTGNICPSGKILKTGMATRNSPRREVLGSGTVNYGHGSIMRGSSGSSNGGHGSGAVDGRTGAGISSTEMSESVIIKRALVSSDLEMVKKVGNDLYNKGQFLKALCLYDRAIAISPGNAVCRSNRAAALTRLDRLAEAVKECEEAVRLDPMYEKAHHRLGSLHLRLGQVGNARQHLSLPGKQPDPRELEKLQLLEKHLSRCSDFRRTRDWKNALKEADAVIATGADSSPQLFACRAESLLKLHQLVDADYGLLSIPKVEPYPLSCSRTKFFGMLSEAYVFFVRAEVEMALGRFGNAVTAAEEAGKIDPLNIEVAMMLNIVRLVKSARDRGNGLFNSEKYIEAASAYGEGLKLDHTNSVLYCNRAACWSKLKQWEKSVEDCNKALKIQPGYTKALLRRAQSNGKLERWAECLRDYELLRKELPGDNEVAEGLFQAQVALQKLRGEEVQSSLLRGVVQELSDIDQFRAVVSSPGVSVIYFKESGNQQCEQLAPFVNMLCIRYQSVSFLKVDVEKSSVIAKVGNVRIVPAFKIYKNGNRVNEMVCPSQQELESSVRCSSF